MKGTPVLHMERMTPSGNKQETNPTSKYVRKGTTDDVWKGNADLGQSSLFPLATTAWVCPIMKCPVSNSWWPVVSRATPTEKGESSHAQC